MKRAVFPGLAAFVFAVLIAAFIGGSVKQSAEIGSDKAFAGFEAQSVFFSAPSSAADQTDGEDRQSAAPDAQAPSETDVITEAQTALEETDAVTDVSQPASDSPSAELPYDAFEKSSSEKTSPSPKKAASSETVIDAVFGSSYVNNLSSSGSVMSFRFKVTQRGVLSYSLFSPSGSALNWRAELYQQYFVNGSSGATALRLLNTLGENASGAEASSPNIGVMPGTYIIKVVSGKVYSDGYFSFRADFTPTTAYEIEYNDSVTRYTEVYPGVPVKGSASYYTEGHDADWYMFRNNSSAAFKLEFSHEELSQGTVAFKVSVFGSDMAELWSGNSLLSSGELTSESLGLSEGVYYISVVSRVYADVDYTLSISRYTHTLYETEKNDTALTADAISPDSPVRGSLSSRSGVSDKDLFVFTLESNGYITAYIKNTEPSSSFKGYERRFTLSDEGGRVIYSVLAADNDETVASPNIGLGAGRYFFTVDDDDLYHACSDYEIGFSFTETNGWEREYNDAPDLSTAVYENISVSGTMADAGTDFDSDWYRFEASREGKVKVGLRHPATGLGNEIFRVYVYNAALEQIGEVLSVSDSAESAYMLFDAVPGEYFIKLTSGRYSSSVRYYLNCSYEEEA